MKKSTIINALILLWLGIFFIVWATNELLKVQSPPSVLIAVTFKWWAVILIIKAIIVLIAKNRNKPE